MDLGLTLSGTELWTIAGTLVTVASTATAIYQARSAKHSADLAKEQVTLAKEQAAQAREANKLTRLDRYASANQLYVEEDSESSFIVTNPMNYDVRAIIVECSGMDNAEAYIRWLSPNTSQKFLLGSRATRWDDVTLRWKDKDRVPQLQHIDAYDIWDHVERR